MGAFISLVADLLYNAPGKFLLALLELFNRVLFDGDFKYLEPCLCTVCIAHVKSTVYFPQILMNRRGTGKQFIHKRMSSI